MGSYPHTAQFRFALVNFGWMGTGFGFGRKAAGCGFAEEHGHLQTKIAI